MTATATTHVTLPLAPRSITPTARKQAWHEMGVQMWWKSAMVIAAIGIAVAFIEVQKALKERALMESGIILEGKLDKVGGVGPKDNPNWKMLRDQGIPVEVSVIMPDGELAVLKGELPAAPGYLAVNGDLTVRVDPDNILNWTEAKEILPWWQVVALPLMFMFPVVALFLLIAFLLRKRKLKIWRTGVLGEGVVIDVRHTGVAPRSRIVRFTHTNGQDKRILKLLYPMRAGIPQSGDVLNLLHPVDRPWEVIVPELYIQPPKR